MLDPSQPYMSVEYKLFYEGDTGPETVKEIHTDYRLESNTVDWLQNQ